jgi:acetolactate synthase-1/2/3 large subunit
MSASEPNPKLLARIKASDLVIVVGSRMGEMPSQSYTLFDIPAPRQTFVHVHPDPRLGRVYRPHSWRSMPRLTAFAAALEGLQAPKRNSVVRGDPHRACRLSAFTENATEVPGASISARSCCGCAASFRATTFSAMAPEILRLAASLLSPEKIQLLHRSDLGLDGIRRAGRGRDEAALSERNVFCLAGDGDFLMNGRNS